MAAAFSTVAVSKAYATAQLGDIFYISMENKDFTDPGGIAENPDQLFQNPAAPFINSLITPGNPNSVDVSYASNYTNAGTNVHPSEPNYIWSEAGTNYNAANGITDLTDDDPSAANGNIFTDTPHLTGLLNAAGIPWMNYQEDYQISGMGPLVTSGGVYPGGATNTYNGSTKYSYAAKHNPMVFFPDTATENVAPLSALATDLADNTVGRYNWITPNEYNDGHSALLNFTYRGIKYEGDLAEIAQADNFLSIVVPEIEASQAFQNNGAIVIWTDETEEGDTTANTLPEIVISPLAKGNAYDSTVPLNHSSDLKTMQEVFGLGPSYLNNPIPSDEYSPAGGPGTVNSVIASNDLSELFQPGVIPSNVPQSWIAPGGGSWSAAANWNGSVIPQSPGQIATFGSAITAPSTVTLDAPWTVATVNFNNPNSYTLAPGAGGSLTLDNGTGNATINDLAGIHTISAPIVLNSNTAITVSNSGDSVTLSGGISGSAAIAVSGSGIVVINDPSNSITGLTIGTDATVDLTTSTLTINYGSNPDPLSTIQGYLASGILTSSSASSTEGRFALGYADGDIDTAAAALPGQLLIEYALVGDANLDGTVNLTDLLVLLNNYGQSSKDWAEGDFNYDGTVNLTDLLALLNNYGQSATLADDSFTGARVVPEPTSACLLALSALGLLGRRRV